MNRRRAVQAISALAMAGLLAGCGFKLRGSLRFAFESIAISPGTGSAVADELRRALEGNVKVMAASSPAAAATTAVPAQVLLDVLTEQREKTVVGVNAAGQVREFQLRIRVKFRLRTPEGRELIAETELLQQRDISFNESAVLAKEAEENLLYRNMQTDIVQQLMRRLAAVTLS